ncbi:hypothetical protein MTO96_016806 [Rhipicephalus appendiculatus]
MKHAWNKSSHIAGAGPDCWGEATPETEELPSIYGSVHHSKRGKSASCSTVGAYVTGNKEGHMSRAC